MNVQLLQYHQQKTEQPYYRCPLCASDDVRLSAIIECSVRPNDPQDPVKDYSMLEPYAEWSDSDDAHCESCGWMGTVEELQQYAENLEKSGRQPSQTSQATQEVTP